MKYLLLVYMPENAINQSEREQCYRDSMQLCHDLQSAGQFITASPLQPVSTARSVRIREGKRLVTDGPFAETREQLGGFYMVDVPDLDAAINAASRIPGAKKGTIEIRPVIELNGLPNTSNAAPLAEAIR